MFGKPNEEKKILIKNDVVVPENLSTNKDVPITITTSTPASAPATAPKEVSGEPKESGPALEGNVVHLK